MPCSNYSFTSFGPVIREGGGADDNHKTANAAAMTMLDSADMGTKQARVLFDYEAVNAHEISVRKGDVRL
jgi:hypothetical protein